MNISGSGKVETAAVRRKSLARSGTGESFSVGPAGSSAYAMPAHGVTGAAPAYAVLALLGLQEVDDQGNGRSRTLTRVGSMLDLLDEIRHGMLLGVIPQHKLRQLVALTKARAEAFVDPRLAEVVGEIELRAKVELAKIEMSGKTV